MSRLPHENRSDVFDSNALQDRAEYMPIIFLAAWQCFIRPPDPRSDEQQDESFIMIGSREYPRSWWAVPGNAESEMSEFNRNSTPAGRERFLATIANPEERVAAAEEARHQLFINNWQVYGDVVLLIAERNYQNWVVQGRPDPIPPDQRYPEMDPDEDEWDEED